MNFYQRTEDGSITRIVDDGLDATNEHSVAAARERGIYLAELPGARPEFEERTQKLSLVPRYDEEKDRIMETWTVEWLSDAELARIVTAKFQNVRNQRNTKLFATDRFMLEDFPISTEEKSAWKEYRRQLRNMFEGLTDPEEVVWPQEPK